MLKERRMVAEQVAGALFEAEAAIDAALAKTAHLTGVMPLLRKQAGASALIGQDDAVEAGQTVATIEAMKMEASITAPVAGTVARLAVPSTQAVEGGDLVLVISPR